MTVDEMREVFKDHHEDEYLEFDRVKSTKRERDMHAFLLLEPFTDTDMISHADYEKIWLSSSMEDVAAHMSTVEIIDLIRCGIMMDDSGFFMDV